MALAMVFPAFPADMLQHKYFCGETDANNSNPSTLIVADPGAWIPA
jgi:hypothetical protein